MKPKEITYEPECGTRIDNACAKALAISIKSGNNVRFRFNDIELTATPKSSLPLILKDWTDQKARDHEAYISTPEYKASVEARKIEVAGLIAKTSYLLGDIDTVLSSKSTLKLMNWLNYFTESSNDNEVKFDHAALAEKFIAAGYKQDEFVGFPKDSFKDHNVMARYIVGQVISCLKSNMPPHPITTTFVEKYFALKSKPI